MVGQDEQAVYEADEEAFSDERGKTPRTFEVWSRRLGMCTARFAPTLWYVTSVLDKQWLARAFSSGVTWSEGFFG